jgi:hypothetical protein
VAWLIDGHLADDYDEVTFRVRWEREFAALSSPEELFLFASESHAAQEPAEWRRVLDHPLCDRGTALLVFWRNSPVYYYGDEPAGGWGRDRERYVLVREIAGRCTAGGYSSAVVRFDPAAFKRSAFSPGTLRRSWSGCRPTCGFQARANPYRRSLHQTSTGMRGGNSKVSSTGDRVALITEPYSEQVKVWPKEGRHILAQFDADTVIVYQAYSPSIGRYAVEHGTFGGDFSYSRMSWIKPNFLWMMYRSGWGTKEGQEVTLALRLRRTFFDSLLAQAVPSSWDRQQFATEEEWSTALGRSSVRLQWDPDHHPSGAKLERRAIQLGLRGEALEAFGQRELVEVLDVSEFVAEQRQRLSSGGVSALVTPRERVYRPADPVVAARLRLAD